MTKAVAPIPAEDLTRQYRAIESEVRQAIVEGDRDKALRALMSNRMVTGYDQAQGLLGGMWP